MSALNDLREYAIAMHEHIAIARQLTQIRLTGAPSGLKAVGGGSRGTNDQTTADIQRLDGLEARLDRKLQELQEKSVAGERALELIAYPKARYVMRCFYVLSMSDADIAEELLISRSTVYRMRKATEADLDGMPGMAPGEEGMKEATEKVDQKSRKNSAAVV